MIKNLNVVCNEIHVDINKENCEGETAFNNGK
jgi:hypothetical protein